MKAGMFVLAMALSVLVGIALGLLGGGGSILMGLARYCKACSLLTEFIRA